MSTSFTTDQSPAGDFETITVSTTAKQIDATKLLINLAGGTHKRAVRAFCTVADNNIRIRFDGTVPTATVGHIIVAGDYVTIDGEQNVSNLRMIRVTGDALVSVTIFYNQ